MIYAAEVETMRDFSPVGGHFVDSLGERYTILSFGSNTFQLESEVGVQFNVVVVTSGPRVDFYCDGLKHEKLSSTTSHYVRPPKAGVKKTV